MEDEELYFEIDKEEDMTDDEKRETYFSELENRKAEERWQKEQEDF